MPHIDFPQSACRASIARRDITPPVGIYHRLWGAATHDRSTGVHQPLTATAMVFQQAEGKAASETEQVLVTMDHVLLWAKEMDDLLNAVSAQSGVPKKRLA